MRLQREGFEPQKSGEKVFYLNNRAGCYKAVTKELYEDIMEGKMSFWDNKIFLKNRENDSFSLLILFFYMVLMFLQLKQIVYNSAIVVVLLQTL